MNILFVFQEDYTTGGATGIMRQVAEHYIGKGDCVYALFLTSRKHGHWDDLCDCENLRLFYGGGISIFVQNLIELRKIRFDYSYTSTVRYTGIVGLLKRCKILHINTIVARESTLIFNRFKGFKLAYYRMWYTIGYKAVSILICQTELMKTELLKHEPKLEKHTKVLVIPNPVNVERMNKRASENISTEEHKPFVVTAGRYIPEKAYDVLLEAFSEFIKKHSGMKLVILGDGVLRAQIENQIKQLGLQQDVYLAGQVENVFPWFRQASLCVVSSRMEGFPNVLLQMMSQNDRVVSTLCAGGVEDIKGLITCPINDSDALYKAMCHCFENSTTGRRELFDEELCKRSIVNFVEEVEKLS